MTRFITGLHEVIDKYDGFVIDLMGVVHNGASLFPGVRDCLEALKKKNKTVVFLSNAPRRSYVAQARLAKFKITDELYHKVITSGEAVHHSLKHRESPWYQKLGVKAYHIGQEKDASLFDDDACHRTDDITQADFILNSDLKARGDCPANYEDVLQEASQRGLPMICANPDLVVQIQDTLEFCAGSIAKRYEELGGEVSYHGKPYPAIYTWVRSAFPAGARLLAIGDSFETDIKGAQNADIDSAFIGCGIHCQDLGIEHGQLPEASKIEHLAKSYGATPTYVLPGLIF